MDFGGGEEANMQEGYQADGTAAALEFALGSIRVSDPSTSFLPPWITNFID